MVRPVVRVCLYMVPQAAKSASWINVLRAVSPLADRPWDVAAATPLGPVAAFSVRPYRLGIAAPWRACVRAFPAARPPQSNQSGFHGYTAGSVPQAVRSR